MKSHQYRITVEHLATPEGGGITHAPLVFTTTNHDDIFAIKERIAGKLDLSPEAEAPFIIGLKLFTEVILMHRKTPLFIKTQKLIWEFMKSLKSHLRQSSP